jgi:hypothetical protein
MKQARVFRVVVAACLLLGAGLFAVGTAIERSGGGRAPSLPSSRRTKEAGKERQEKAHRPRRDRTAGGTIFGIDRESGPLVALGIPISLALALAVVLTRSAAPLGIAVAFAEA